MTKDDIKRRISVFILGLGLSGFGVAMTTQAGLGTTPISSLPYVLTFLMPLSLGMLTLLLNVFLVFGLSDFTFDQGGFAAFVMLSGIVVNAGIYMVNEMTGDRSGRDGVRKYVRAFNHKIKPVMLTVISTVLGLIPFLFDGPDEVFWFAFAVGTMGGMLFSVIALVVYFPVFSIRYSRPRRKVRRLRIAFRKR